MSAFPIEQQLRQIPLFADLDDENLRLLVSRLRRRRFGAGEYLFHEGDPGQTLYLILSGFVQVEKSGASGAPIPIARRGPGDHFGEMALFDDKGRSADVSTIGPCDLLMLDRRDFMQLLEEHPHLAWAIIRTLSERLREASDQLRRERSGDALSRLALLLYEEALAQGGSESERVLQLGSTDKIAQRLGITREHTSRLLSRLRAQGLVERKGRALIVRSLPRLRRLGEG